MGGAMREFPGTRGVPLGMPPPGGAMDRMVGAAVVALIAVVGIVVVDLVRRDEPVPVTGSCDTVSVDRVRRGEHRNRPLDYRDAPPSSGDHAEYPLPKDSLLVRRPAPSDVVERAVQNLERGYVVIFYSQDVGDGDLRVVVDAAAEAGVPKVLVVPWDRGPYDVGAKKFVLTAWGHRLPCDAPEPGTIRTFWERHGGPNGIAPEKDMP